MTDDLTKGVPPLAAGRELDVMVAERVMGLPLFWHEYYLTGDGKLTRCGPYLNPQDSGESVNEDVPAYSTDIAAALTVVEKLRPMGTLTINITTDDRGPSHVIVWLTNNAKDSLGGLTMLRSYTRTLAEVGGDDVAKATALAICRAALVAVAGDVPA